MNIYCDNYSVCNSYLQDGITEDRARVKGWHLFNGTDQGGKEHKAVLCPRCVDTKRRTLDPAPLPQLGDQQLFIIEVQIEDP
jgi:hypothetical protein